MSGRQSARRRRRVTILLGAEHHSMSRGKAREERKVEGDERKDAHSDASSNAVVPRRTW